jgi:hypothetical protein
LLGCDGFDAGNAGAACRTGISQAQALLARGRPIRELSPHHDARAVRPYRLIVQFSISNREYLPGPIHDGITLLGDKKRARQDQAPDLEKMPVPALAGTSGQLLQFDFLVTVGSELRFKFALVHLSLLQVYLLSSRSQGW